MGLKNHEYFARQKQSTKITFMAFLRAYVVVNDFAALLVC